VGYLRLRKVVVKTITVKFGVNDGCGSGRGCFGIEIRADTAELTNMIIAVFGERDEIWSEKLRCSAMKPRL